jgi:hypothetical protein
MKISGFTIVRNALKYHYPVVESIKSILPICDEFIVNVGDSQDATLSLIMAIRDPKIRIIQSKWNFSMGKEVLSYQTNLALKECRGDWAFYIQSDEVIHEADLPGLAALMRRNAGREDIDALRFRWLHFYGSYYRYRVDAGWYQKQDRIIRNNGQIESLGDAWGFQRKDGQELKRLASGCYVYHYGWVNPGGIMTSRRVNAERIGFTALKSGEREGDYSYGDLDCYPPFFGSHPAAMQERIRTHQASAADLRDIRRRFWWHPGLWFKIRHKIASHGNKISSPGERDHEEPAA